MKIFDFIDVDKFLVKSLKEVTNNDMVVKSKYAFIS